MIDLPPLDDLLNAPGRINAFLGAMDTRPVAGLSTDALEEIAEALAVGARGKVIAAAAISRTATQIPFNRLDEKARAHLEEARAFNTAERILRHLSKRGCV